MRLLCDACGRTLPPGGFRLEGSTLVLLCAGCGAEARTSPGPAAPAAPSLAPALAAPAVSPAAAPEASPAPVAPPASPPLPLSRLPAAALDEGPDPAEDWLSLRFAELRLAWEDPAAHDRVLTEAFARDAVADLGRRYSEHLAKHPGDDAAAAARDALVKRATLQLMSQLPAQERSIGPDQVKTFRAVLVVLLFAGVAAFAYFVLQGLAK